MPTWLFTIERTVAVEANTRAEAGVAVRPFLHEDETHADPVLVNWRHGVDDRGNPLIIINHYVCEGCNIEWEAPWSCQVPDDCPVCGKDFEPTHSTDIE